MASRPHGRKLSAGGRSGGDARLRARAEAALAERSPPVEEFSRDELLVAAEELRVHQVELEMQNEELRRAQVEAEESRDRYAELYDFAPIACLTLDAAGDIVEFNRATLDLFGGPADRLRGLSFVKLMVTGSRAPYLKFLQEVRNAPDRRECELDFNGARGTIFVGHLVSETFGDPSGLLRIRCAILDVTARRQVERALRASEREVLAISEREQRRIGADLHDNLGQWLTATEFLGTALREQVRQKCPELEPQCDQICENLREAVAQARAMAHGLVPVCLDLTGLMDAIAQLAERITRIGKAVCRFTCPQPVLFHRSETATHVFRIAQEAVSNALKHGRVRNIEIRLEQTGAEILLRIEDDGGGFEPPLAGGRGMGLNVMHHRARIIGATIDIDPGPGRGVVVQCRLPQIRA